MIAKRLELLREELRREHLGAYIFNTSDPHDFSGNSPEQPPTWIRPMALIGEMIPDYDQVVGHTPVEHCFNVKDVMADTPYNLWLCDALDQGAYLCIENGVITEQNING